MPHISELTKEKLIELRDKGLKQKEIASIYNISYFYLNKISRKKFNISFPNNGGSTLVDIKGKIFNRLKVVSFSHMDKYNGSFWNCICECGNKKVTSRKCLLNNQCNSCGCFFREQISKTGLNHPNWKGGKYISYTYFNSCKYHCCRGRTLEFTITIPYVEKLYEKQSKKCRFTGVPLEFDENQTASLDRIDSNKGYIVGNVQWVHKTVNIMKQDLTDKEFIEWCVRVRNYSLTEREVILQAIPIFNANPDMWSVKGKTIIST